jgi:archaellum biogenesis protein FlaJ (TadC family)
MAVVSDKKKLKIAALVSLSFTGIVVLVMVLLVKGVVTFQMALLMLVALLGLYFGFGVLIFIYRFVDRLK